MSSDKNKEKKKSKKSASPQETIPPKNGQSTTQSGNSFGGMLKKAKKCLTTLALQQKDKGVSSSNDTPAETQETSPSTTNKVTRRQKRRLNLKLKRQHKATLQGDMLMQSETEKHLDSNTSQQIKKKRRRRRKSGDKNEENSDSPQNKLGKFVKVQAKFEKAKKVKGSKEGELSLMEGSEEIGSSSSQVNNEDQNNIALKKKLRNLEKKKRKKAAALAKRTELQKDNVISNEVVLSRNQKKKMRKIAKKESEKKRLQEANGQGTTNSSYDTSFSETVLAQVSNDNDPSNIKKKKRRRKNKNSISDSVDGNIASTSKTFKLISSSDSSKRTVLPGITEPGSKVEKSQKKKMMIAKLLQQSEIDEKSTLFDLKKKRLSEKEGSDMDTTSKKQKQSPAPLRERMGEQLKSARFR